MAKKKSIKQSKNKKPMSKQELEHTVGGATAIQYGLIAASISPAVQAALAAQKAVKKP